MSRSKNMFRSAWLVIIALASAAGVVTASIYLADTLSTKTTGLKSCGSTHGTSHLVIIRQGVADPYNTVARRCDSLTITNLDGTNRLVAFGIHEKHARYDGIEERLLGQGGSLKVNLVQTGNFRFHDHLHDEVQGTFSVRQ